MKKPLSVFTEKYSEKVNKILNSVVIINSETKFTIPAKALWDTGATGTCISKELVQKLNLIPIGMQRIQTPSGSGTVNQYKIHLVLNDEVLIPDVTVVDSEIGNQGLDVLIGMDIISLGDFAISNYDKKTQFSFRIPSQEHVDYRRQLEQSECYTENLEVATTQEENK